MKVTSLSRVQPSVTPWTAVYQAALSVGFSRQEYWSGWPLPASLLAQTVKRLSAIPETRVRSLGQEDPPGEGNAATAAKSLQPCPTLCDPMDCSLPGSSVRGIFQARVLEWSAIAFSTILGQINFEKEYL